MFRFFTAVLLCLQLDYSSISSTSFLSTSHKAFNSSSVNVTPFPIFSWLGAQVLKSYFGSLPFQLILLSSRFHPLELVDITPFNQNRSSTAFLLNTANVFLFKTCLIYHLLPPACLYNFLFCLQHFYVRHIVPVCFRLLYIFQMLYRKYYCTLIH